MNIRRGVPGDKIIGYQYIVAALFWSLSTQTIVPEYRTPDTNPWARDVQQGNNHHNNTVNGTVNGSMNSDFFTEMSIEGEVERIISKFEESPEEVSKHRRELERLQLILPEVSTAEQKKGFLERLAPLGVTFNGPGFEFDTSEMVGEAQGLIDEIKGIEAATKDDEDLVVATSAQVARLFELLQSIGTSTERDALLDQTHTLRSPLPEIFLERASDQIDADHIIVDEADEAMLAAQVNEHAQYLAELRRRIDQLEAEELIDAEQCERYREQYEQVQRELSLLQEQEATCPLLSTNGNGSEADHTLNGNGNGNGSNGNGLNGHENGLLDEELINTHEHFGE